MSHERKVFSKKYHNRNREFGLDIDEFESENGGLLYMVNLSDKYRNADFFNCNVNFEMNEGQLRELFQALSNEMDHLRKPPTGGYISGVDLAKITESTSLSPMPYFNPSSKWTLVTPEKNEKIIPLDSLEKDQKQDDVYKMLRKTFDEIEEKRKAKEQKEEDQ